MTPARALIPPPLDSDFEDVHWALEAATALWERGEQEEALKWLRRAANSAADRDADQRAVELFKAAAEVANSIQRKRPPGPPPAPTAPPQEPPSDPDVMKTPVAKQAARPREDGETESTTERRKRRGLFFDESEERTFVTPETALRRALMQIDPDYARRTDFHSEPDPSELERTSVPDDPRASQPPVPARRAPSSAEEEAVSLHSIPPEEPSSEPSSEVAPTRRDSSHDHPRPSSRTKSRVSSSPVSSTPSSEVSSPLPVGALPAMRVAVIPIPEEGDVRLLFLAPGAPAPAGVASALLVPTTDRDAQLIAELYEQTDAKL